MNLIIDANVIMSAIIATEGKPDDTEYLALALKLKSSIWSNDKRLKKQDRVAICSTNELIKLI